MTCPLPFFGENVIKRSDKGRESHELNFSLVTASENKKGTWVRSKSFIFGWFRNRNRCRHCGDQNQSQWSWRNLSLLPRRPDLKRVNKCQGLLSWTWTLGHSAPVVPPFLVWCPPPEELDALDETTYFPVCMCRSPSALRQYHFNLIMYTGKWNLFIVSNRFTEINSQLTNWIFDFIQWKCLRVVWIGPQSDSLD